MGEITITLDGGQAYTVRHSVAEDAADTAKALVARLEDIMDGFYKEADAKHARESLDYLMTMLDTGVGVLRQLPWSEEAELACGLSDNPAKSRRMLAISKRRDKVERGAARYKDDADHREHAAELMFRWRDEHPIGRTVWNELGEEFPVKSTNALCKFVDLDHGSVTLEDLAAVYTCDEVAAVDGLGPRSLAMINAAMDACGLAFAEPAEVTV